MCDGSKGGDKLVINSTEGNKIWIAFNLFIVNTVLLLINKSKLINILFIERFNSVSNIYNPLQLKVQDNFNI